MGANAPASLQSKHRRSSDLVAAMRRRDGWRAHAPERMLTYSPIPLILPAFVKYPEQMALRTTSQSEPQEMTDIRSVFIWSSSWPRTSRTFFIACQSTATAVSEHRQSHLDGGQTIGAEGAAP